MQRLSVRHDTLYRYRQPVRFHDHRLMVRPRDSHDLRLIDAELTIAPPPVSTRWYHDVFSNSIAVLGFDETRSAELRVTSTIELERYPTLEPPAIDPSAENLPFAYPWEEFPDLIASRQVHYPDPEGSVDAWALSFLQRDGTGATEQVLADMAREIPAAFTYGVREEHGTQSPADTLARRAGTCRDYALLMMEACRRLGIAARFVSGYLYDPGSDPAQPTTAPHLVGAGATHAWVEVYLPGAGWIEYDPTNGIVGGQNLIRVAVARDPRQAVPVSGSFTGWAGDYIGMEVSVEVTDRKAGEARRFA